ALVLLVWGMSQTRPTAVTITYSDPAVRSLEPQPGALALRQERIGVTLASDFTLAEQAASGLYVNNVGIPQDQIEFIPGLNQYFFTPGPGKDVASLPPGRNCAKILIRRIASAGDAGPPFGWCFNSH